MLPPSGKRSGRDRLEVELSRARGHRGARRRAGARALAAPASRGQTGSSGSTASETATASYSQVGARLQPSLRSLTTTRACALWRANASWRASCHRSTGRARRSRRARSGGRSVMCASVTRSTGRTSTRNACAYEMTAATMAVAALPKGTRKGKGCTSAGGPRDVMVGVLVGGGLLALNKMLYV